ncbi:hypothetical protein OH77DRAFT_1423938 [Trametes cingulata]|nr:hypothetical protein OH77DRAFT_1423938 [Trametes cingulata]
MRGHARIEELCAPMQAVLPAGRFFSPLVPKPCPAWRACAGRPVAGATEFKFRENVDGNGIPSASRVPACCYYMHGHNRLRWATRRGWTWEARSIELTRRKQAPFIYLLTGISEQRQRRNARS